MPRLQRVALSRGSIHELFGPVSASSPAQPPVVIIKKKRLPEHPEDLSTDPTVMLHHAHAETAEQQDPERPPRVFRVKPLGCQDMGAVASVGASESAQDGQMPLTSENTPESARVRAGKKRSPRDPLKEPVLIRHVVVKHDAPTASADTACVDTRYGAYLQLKEELAELGRKLKRYQRDRLVAQRLFQALAHQRDSVPSGQASQDTVQDAAAQS